MARIDRFQLPRKTLESEHLPGIADAAEVGKAGKNSERGGKRESELLEADGNFGGQDGSRRRAINSNVVRLVGFQQFSIDRDNIIYSGGERTLRGETIVDGNDFNPGQIRDRDTFDQRARIGIESATVKIDKHAIVFRSGERRDDVSADTRHTGFLDIDRVTRARLGGVFLAPGIGARAAFGERLGWPRFLLLHRFEVERLQPLPRFRTDGRWHRNDARDMRGAIGVEGGGVLWRVG